MTMCSYWWWWKPCGNATRHGQLAGCFCAARRKADSTAFAKRWRQRERDTTWTVRFRFRNERVQNLFMGTMCVPPSWSQEECCEEFQGFTAAAEPLTRTTRLRRRDYWWWTPKRKSFNFFFLWQKGEMDREKPKRGIFFSFAAFLLKKKIIRYPLWWSETFLVFCGANKKRPQNDAANNHTKRLSNNTMEGRRQWRTCPMPHDVIETPQGNWPAF